MNLFLFLLTVLDKNNKHSICMVRAFCFSVPGEQGNLTVQEWISHCFSIFAFSQNHWSKTYNLFLNFPICVMILMSIHLAVIFHANILLWSVQRWGSISSCKALALLHTSLWPRWSRMLCKAVALLHTIIIKRQIFSMGHFIESE